MAVQGEDEEIGRHTRHIKMERRKKEKSSFLPSLLSNKTKSRERDDSRKSINSAGD